jgi:CRP-like cAMP-binding protein
MSVSATHLAGLPLFQALGEEALGRLAGRFEAAPVGADRALFRAGDPAEHLYLLTSGTVELVEDDRTRIVIRAVTLIGELGGLTPGVSRNTTALAKEGSELYRVAREELLRALDAEPAAGLQVIRNLLGVLSEKIRRDSRRIRQMRQNLIHTQKAMKALREEILSQPDTVISDAAHDTLDGLIARNRRANYEIEPPQSLPARVRTAQGELLPVLTIERNRLALPPAAAQPTDTEWRGVLVLPQTEIPISGSVAERGSGGVRIELDLLLDDYAAALEDYLVRAQMLDVVV